MPETSERAPPEAARVQQAVLSSSPQTQTRAERTLGQALAREVSGAIPGVAGKMPAAHQGSKGDWSHANHTFGSADCHEIKPHKARDMCVMCYGKWRWQNHKRIIKGLPSHEWQGSGNQRVSRRVYTPPSITGDGTEAARPSGPALRLCILRHASAARGIFSRLAHNPDFPRCQVAKRLDRTKRRSDRRYQSVVIRASWPACFLRHGVAPSSGPGDGDIRPKGEDVQPKGEDIQPSSTVELALSQ